MNRSGSREGDIWITLGIVKFVRQINFLFRFRFSILGKIWGLFLYQWGRNGCNYFDSGCVAVFVLIVRILSPCCLALTPSLSRTVIEHRAVGAGQKHRDEFVHRFRWLLLFFQRHAWP